MITSVDEKEDDDDEVLPNFGEILATVATDHPGFAVLDTGATESIASLEALEALMKIREKKYGTENITVYERHRKFRFGNGQE